jgi:hypothetical protein
MSDHEINTAKCGVCGALKGATNHWHVLRVLYGILRVQKFYPDFARSKGSVPACGRACAQKLVERFLETGSLEPSRKPAGESQLPLKPAGEPA